MKALLIALVLVLAVTVGVSTPATAFHGGGSCFGTAGMICWAVHDTVTEVLCALGLGSCT